MRTLDQLVVRNFKSIREQTLKLEQLNVERYQKALHGPLIAARIGLDVIRRECPHFGSWLTELESLPG